MHIDSNTVISLPAGVTYDNNCLYDHIVDQRYPLNETGSIIIRELLNGANVRQACVCLAELCKEQPDEIQSDVIGLLKALNNKTLVHLYTPWVLLGKLKTYARNPRKTFYVGLARFLAFEPEIKATRYQCTLAGLLSSLRLFMVLMLATGAGAAATILIATSLATPAFPPNSKTYVIAATPLLGSIILIFLIILHEKGHMWALHKNGKLAQSYIVSRGLAVGVAHPQLPRKLGIKVSIIGPCFAFTTGLTLALAMWALHAPELHVAVTIILSVANLWTLTPWNKDGQILWGLKQG